MLDQHWQSQSDATLFRALIRLMHQLVNHNHGNAAEWARVDESFNQWHNLLPPAFLGFASWPSSADDAEYTPNGALPSPDLDSREIWFGSDVSAVAMMFYHMCRMLLLIGRPIEVFFRTRSQHSPDLLRAYSDLRQALRKHALEIIPTALGVPSETVRKYMLQPLYVAGRCLESTSDRQCVLRILCDMEHDLGIATEYRAKDLIQEWGMPSNALERLRDDCG